MAQAVRTSPNPSTPVGACLNGGRRTELEYLQSLGHTRGFYIEAPALPFLGELGGACRQRWVKVMTNAQGAGHRIRVQMVGVIGSPSQHRI